MKKKIFISRHELYNKSEQKHFALLFALKIEKFAQKTKERIPNPALF